MPLGKHPFEKLELANTETSIQVELLSTRGEAAGQSGRISRTRLSPISFLLWFHLQAIRVGSLKITDQDSKRLLTQIPSELNTLLGQLGLLPLFSQPPAWGADPQKLLPPKGKWPEDVFGWFVRLEYDQNGNLNVKVQDEDLMPGDAANPPPQVKALPLSKRIKKVTLAARAGKGMAEAEESIQTADSCFADLGGRRFLAHHSSLTFAVDTSP